MAKKIIESYQVGKSGTFGDLLSKRIDKRKPRVGLLACGYFSTGACTTDLKTR